METSKIARETLEEFKRIRRMRRADREYYGAPSSMPLFVSSSVAVLAVGGFCLLFWS